MMIPRCCDYASVAPVTGAKAREHSTSRGVSPRETGLQAADGVLQGGGSRPIGCRRELRHDPAGPGVSTLKP